MSDKILQALWYAEMEKGRAWLLGEGVTNCRLPGVVVDEEYSAVRVDSLLPSLGQRTQVILVPPDNNSLME